MAWIIGIFIVITVFNVKALHYIWREQQLISRAVENQKNQSNDTIDRITEITELVRDIAEARSAPDPEPVQINMEVRDDEGTREAIMNHFEMWRGAIEGTTQAGIMATFRRMLSESLPVTVDRQPLIDAFENALEACATGHIKESEDGEEQEPEHRPSRRLNIERE